ncbi:hypothetical protein RRG08_012411 [Elysia crispata]|uniref:Uncharacterized protein n=1 Tax=Elysia crispata TaxID=231223 RepID=A0AAE0YLT3_9GAST|nr:hypothetical protein RRG08_012411 [Elysia crispata]
MAVITHSVYPGATKECGYLTGVFSSAACPGRGNTTRDFETRSPTVILNLRQIENYRKILPTLLTKFRDPFSNGDTESPTNRKVPKDLTNFINQVFRAPFCNGDTESPTNQELENDLTNCNDQVSGPVL